MITMQKDLTYKYNMSMGRHGWLRLTPAYSLKLVQDILEQNGKPRAILDPFSGSGTTGLVCAEQGISSWMVEINPFLAWVAKVKTSNYSEKELSEISFTAKKIVIEAAKSKKHLWVPPISNIGRWWTNEYLDALSDLFEALKRNCKESSASVTDILKIVFCKLVIKYSNAAFNHQSVSFKSPVQKLLADKDALLDDFVITAEQLSRSATGKLSGQTTVVEDDSRHLNKIPDAYFDCVITSPPYPNRMSYIRELRPYMYWLGYLNKASEAGEIDWETIGGTWGSATSRLADWNPNGDIPYSGFDKITEEISNRSDILANYVRKYFEDMSMHFASLRKKLTSDAKIFYIIGNSKFYNTLVPAEEIFLSMLEKNGFRNSSSKIIRKRSSKKALYEFLVSAEY